MALRSRSLKGNIFTKRGRRSPLDPTAERLSIGSLNRHRQEKSEGAGLMQKLQVPGVPALSPGQFLRDRLCARKAGLITTSRTRDVATCLCLSLGDRLRLNLPFYHPIQDCFMGV